MVFPVRMTVLRLRDGLLLISPIAIDDELTRELAAIGPVRYILAPNLLHHLYLPAACTRYPDAAVYGVPGLERKRPEVQFTGVLDGSTHSPWPEIAIFAIDGAPPVREVVLHHTSSRSMIVTDLVFNMERALSPASWVILRLFARALGGVAQSRLWRLFTRDRQAAGASVRAVLTADFDRLIMAHGDIIHTGGREALMQGTQWMRQEQDHLPDHRPLATAARKPPRASGNSGPH